MKTSKDKTLKFFQFKYLTLLYEYVKLIEHILTITSGIHSETRKQLDKFVNGT